MVKDNSSYLYYSLYYSKDKEIMSELSEDSKFEISIKTLIAIGVGLSTLIGMWFALQADIEEAKQLPEPEISRTEFDLKDRLVRETIMNTGKKVEENSEALKKIDEKLFEIISR
jgi:replicative superfamily II helicase